ncbi:MAG TPA: hypothetical protein VHD63_07785, partial [Ktedonobacteraceae bacterium]|nr:hypothetical protein [Ktedonobacteraceae bacterium]
LQKHLGESRCGEQSATTFPTGSNIDPLQKHLGESRCGEQSATTFSTGSSEIARSLIRSGAPTSA